MLIQGKSRLRGISVIEILMALAVVAIILSFATTTFGKAAHKKEVLVAAEGVDFSVRSARNVARGMETPVLMHFNTSPDDALHSISFSLPDRAASATAESPLQDFVLPADIHLSVSQAVIRFDGRGLLEAPLNIELVSTLDASASETLFFQ